MGASNPRRPARALPRNVFRHSNWKFGIVESRQGPSEEVNVPEDLIDGDGDEVGGGEEGAVGGDAEVGVEEGGVA